MLLFVIVTIVYFVLIMFDVRPLIESKSGKVIWAYSSILVVSYIILILLIFGVKIPSPNVAITEFFKLILS